MHSRKVKPRDSVCRHRLAYVDDFFVEMGNHHGHNSHKSEDAVSQGSNNGSRKSFRRHSSPVEAQEKPFEQMLPLERLAKVIIKWLALSYLLLWVNFECHLYIFECWHIYIVNHCLGFCINKLIVFVMKYTQCKCSVMSTIAYVFGLFLRV